jgi:predicted nucleotidyltransferase
MYRIKDNELSKVVHVIVDKVLPQKIFLFGSRAMNHANEKSDYDIFVLVKSCKHPRKTEKDIYYLLAREGIGIPVDLLVDTEERFERLKGNRYLIYHEVEKYGKTLYDKETASPGMA